HGPWCACAPSAGRRTDGQRIDMVLSRLPAWWPDAGRFATHPPAPGAPAVPASTAPEASAYGPAAAARACAGSRGRQLSAVDGLRPFVGEEGLQPFGAPHRPDMTGVVRREAERGAARRRRMHLAASPEVREPAG